MAKSCKWTPTAYKRVGRRIVEEKSKLYDDIYEAMEGDRSSAIKMWAYTKTEDFKNKYGSNVEFDELGEVTFPSLLKALDLEEVYIKQRNIKQAAKDYGFIDKIFNGNEVVEKINNFNYKEKKFVAVAYPKENGYEIQVLPKSPVNSEKARKQSYNYALTKEIISLLREIGFGVTWVDNPRYAGLFDPNNATLHDGLIEIIKIAKGELGEQALPEEFAHLIIEGLIDHPLVDRLLASISLDQVKEVLGEDYNKYMQLYEGNTVKMTKEAAGKMLGNYIVSRGTLRQQAIQKNKSLLSRAWNWAKGMFSKVTNRRIEEARADAHDAVAGIYNLISSGDIVQLVDRHNIVNAENLYRITPTYSSNTLNNAEEIAIAGETIIAKRRKMEFSHGKIKEAAASSVSLKAIQKLNEGDVQTYDSIATFLTDCRRVLNEAIERTKENANNEDSGQLTEMQMINNISKTVRYIMTIDQAYRRILTAIGSYDPETNDVLQMAEGAGESLALSARALVSVLDRLIVWKRNTVQNILYRAVIANGFMDEKVRGIGRDRDKIMSLKEILDHADRDINVFDRWLTAMSDADDAFLVLMESIVKNQQAERDIEIEEWRKKIAYADKELRDAGFKSDFMIEIGEDGIPTGRLISDYDWDTYIKELQEERERLKALNLSREAYNKKLNEWKNQTNKNGEKRLIAVYVDPTYQAAYEEGKPVPEEASQEMVPNPKFYRNKAGTLASLNPAQKKYYDTVMDIKRTMMTKIPHRGHFIYNAIYISKDFVEGVLDSNNGNILKTTLEHYRKKYTRRPDDLGFGTSETFPADIRKILDKEEDHKKAAREIIDTLKESIEDDINVYISEKELVGILDNGKKYDKNKEQIVDEILEFLDKLNYYLVETDFADHKIQRLPIYYTRRFKDLRNLSTDFSGCLTAYMTMAVNYEKMNEVVDILEVARGYLNEEEGRKLYDKNGNYSVLSRFTAFGKVYRSFVELAGNGTNTAGRMDDFMNMVVYEEYKKDEGSVAIPILNVNLDVAKAADAIKNYTGILGLGFNIFSALSNITVGKIQQWIEAAAGEYFNISDYLKACAQYAVEMPKVLAEMNSPVKKEKLSLLIQMFDPMGEFYTSVKSSHMNKNPVARILGNGVLAYLGMNAGEHLLHCQTMLAILNHTKLYYMENGEEKSISLYDALEVVEGKDGITRLELKKGMCYYRELIDHTGTITTNKNYGRPLRDKDDKIVREQVSLDKSNNWTRYMIKRKREIRKVNDSLNGAFTLSDRGALNRLAIGRMILQYRQWMPAHYMRRFARAHYDDDLERWREGYYVTVYKLMRDLGNELRKGSYEFAKVMKTLGEHEKANLRRASAEVGWFVALMILCRIGGKVSDRDRNWADKMALYQIHRMYLEVGASQPFYPPMFLSNIFTMLNSPAASVDFLEKVGDLTKLYNLFDEVQSGYYQGWSEYFRDAVKLTPIEQIIKGYVFDDSMFAMYEKED